MSDLSHSVPKPVEAASELQLLRSGTFGAVVFLSDLAVIVLSSLLTGIAYHLMVHETVGNLALFINTGLTIGLFFTLPFLFREKYSLLGFITKSDQTISLFLIWNYAFLCMFAIGFLTKSTEIYSRGALVLLYIVGFAGIAYLRLWVRRLVRFGCQTGRVAARQVILIGTHDKTREFLQRHQPWSLGMRTQHTIFIDDHLNSSCEKITDHAGLDNALDEAVKLARQDRTDDIILLVPWSNSSLIDLCVNRLMTSSVSVHLGPQPIFDRFIDAHLTKLGTINTLNLVHPPLNTMEVALKRGFDILASSFGLLLLSPMLLTFAILIRLDSPGPALFRQRRYGFNLAPFNILKFRTMTVMEDGETVVQATRNDPRITRIGKFMRKWNIDELPQLVNVLKGDMSLVGPRPHALAHDHEFATKIAQYARRMNVKPGITGFAQINGYRGPTDTDEKIQRRVECDLYYIDNWSFWLDLNILIKTVFSKKAYTNAC